MFRVFSFVCTHPRDYLTFLRISKQWAAILKDSLVVWRIIKERSPQASKFLKGVDVEQTTDGKQVRTLVQEACALEQLQNLQTFTKKVTEMYKYNSMKMNVPNKMLDWLQLRLDVRIGKSVVAENHPFSCSMMNYAGFAYSEISQISRIPLSEFDNLPVVLIFRSARVSKSVELAYNINKMDLLNKSIKTKVFNYYIKESLTLLFFEGDKFILKSLFEISCVHLINAFAKVLDEARKPLTKVISKQKSSKFDDKYQATISRLSYDSVKDYLVEQTHFEVSLSMHNAKERTLYFVNTTDRPTEVPNFRESVQRMAALSAKTFGSTPAPKSASGVRFLFENIGEPLENYDTHLKLNNELGISQKINDLLFCELVVKDSEKIRFVDSGLRFLQRTSTAEPAYADFSGNLKILLTSFGPEYCYNCEIEQINEEQENNKYSRHGWNQEPKTTMLLQNVEILIGEALICQ